MLKKLRHFPKVGETEGLTTASCCLLQFCFLKRISPFVPGWGQVKLKTSPTRTALQDFICSLRLKKQINIDTRTFTLRTITPQTISPLALTLHPRQPREPCFQGAKLSFNYKTVQNALTVLQPKWCLCSDLKSSKFNFIDIFIMKVK